MMQPLAADVQLFKSKRDATLGYIVARRDSPFVRFCLLAESVIKTHDALVATYIPRDEVPRTQPAGQGHVDAFDVFDVSSEDDSTQLRKPIYDEESGAVPQRDQVANAEAHVQNSNAIEQHSGELNHPGMRRRSGQSPPPPNHNSGNDHTVVSVNLGGQPSPPSRPLFRQAPTSVIPGDVDRSVLVKRMPPAYDTDPRTNLEGPDEYCVINKIVLWNAYSVYTSIRSVDVGLIRAIDNGEVNLAVQTSMERRGDDRGNDTNTVTVDQAAEVARKRINQWRMNYADHLMTYNTAIDVFVAKSTGYLVQAKERGDTDAETLLGFIHAMNQYKAMTIPDPRRADDAEPGDGL
jgi:hypothetical protein